MVAPDFSGFFKGRPPNDGFDGYQGSVTFCTNQPVEIIVTKMRMQGAEGLDLNWQPNEPPGFSNTERSFEERTMFCSRYFNILFCNTLEIGGCQKNNKIDDYENRIKALEELIWQSKRLYFDIYYTRDGSEEIKESFVFKQKWRGYVAGWY